MTKGNLYLIPTTLGDNAPLEVLPISVKKIIELNPILINYMRKRDKIYLPYQFCYWKSKKKASSPTPNSVNIWNRMARFLGSL